MLAPSVDAGSPAATTNILDWEPSMVPVAAKQPETMHTKGRTPLSGRGVEILSRGEIKLLLVQALVGLPSVHPQSSKPCALAIDSNLQSLTFYALYTIHQIKAHTSKHGRHE